MNDTDERHDSRRYCGGLGGLELGPKPEDLSWRKIEVSVWYFAVIAATYLLSQISYLGIGASID